MHHPERFPSRGSPRNNEPIRAARIYVTPPDHHMIVKEECIGLWRGPRENRQRPAINVLFRSAAVAHREMVIGMVLSGYLDDGSAGLWWVKQYGGVAVVQDPRDALVPDMPCSALDHVDVDYSVKVAEAGSLLSTIVRQRSSHPAQKLV